MQHYHHIIITTKLPQKTIGLHLTTPLGQYDNIFIHTLITTLEQNPSAGCHSIVTGSPLWQSVCAYDSYFEKIEPYTTSDHFKATLNKTQ